MYKEFDKSAGDVVVCEGLDGEFMATIVEVNYDECYCIVTDQNDEVFCVDFDSIAE